MPPEPLPWDRKDFVKERKHERSDSIGSIARWKEPHQGSRGFGRWGHDEFRRPPGHGKQGGYQLFSEESGHGCTPSRPSERMAGDESSFRPSATRVDGKHDRSNWEARGAFILKDSKGRPWEASDASINSSGRQHYLSAQRSVSDLVTYTSHPHSDIENSSWDHLHFKDQHDKMASVDSLGTGQVCDTAQSLSPIAWKPMKWNRSSSLVSRGSGFSHSNSPRSSKADFDETKLDFSAEGVTPIQSPSGDTAGGVASSAEFEDTCPRKKPRLGWGQGLAKYEKEKVEGSDEAVNKNGLVPCNAKVLQSIIPVLPDKSPRVTGLECASPVTTSSVGCSSSPGLVDKSYDRLANNDIDTSNLSGSPGHGFEITLEEFPLSLDNLELNSATKLSSVLTDLLQPEDASSGDSSFVNSTTMNKLMLLKREFSKALEKTECEIDLLENGLKLLNSEPETNGSRQTPSDSVQVDFESKSQEVDAISNVFQKPGPLQLVSSVDLPLEKPILCNDTLEEASAEVKDNNIDSPGTATSKFVESLSLERAVSAFDSGKHDGCSADALAAGSISFKEQCFMPSVDEKKSGSVSGSRDHNHQNEPSTIDHFSSDLSQLSNAECKLNDLILVSNRDSARKVSEVFGKLLPSSQSQIDIWGASSTSCLQNNSLVKEKLATRNYFLRFKKQVLTLKFRVFQHLWREDMRLLSIRKYRAKSLKRFELNSRTSHSGYQKQRPSIRSRFTSPAGNLTLVPTTEIVDFTSKLLSDSQIKLYRDSLKMPSLILDEKEKGLSRFVTSNGLVEDPCAIEKEKMMINPWMPQEKEIFLEKLATFGKDFKKIASFLDHKTTGDCIEFYYKNHKSETFDKIKKKSELRKQARSFPSNTYLVTSGKKWNREVNAASLDLLGAASVIAARADDSKKTQQTCVRPFLGGHYEYKTCWGVDALCEKSSSIDILGNEREAAAADALAGICGALSSEAMSSCVTSSVDPGEGCQEWKFQNRNSVMDRPVTPEVVQNIDDEETCSDESCRELDSVDWTDEEKSEFIRAVRSYGKDFVKISRCIGTRSRDQCKIFFSKTRKCLGLDVVHPVSGKEDTPVSDGNGGRSDTEDACVLEMESAICSTQSCSKMDVDFPLSISRTNCEVSRYAGDTHLQTEPETTGERNGVERFDCEDVETGVEPLILDSCLARVKPELVSDGDNNLVSVVEGKFHGTPEVTQADGAAKTDAKLCDPIVPLHGNLDLTAETESAKEQRITEIEESKCAEGLTGLAHYMPNAAIKFKSTTGASAEHHNIESEHQRFLLHESEYGDRRDLKTGLDTKNSISNSCCLVQDSNTNSNTSHPISDIRVLPSFSLTPNHQTPISLELLSSVQKAQIISWEQKENCPSVSANLLSQDSSGIPCGNRLQQAASSSVLNFEDPGNRQHQKPTSADVHQKHLLGHHSFNQVEPSQILRGYPLQVLNTRERNGHADSISDEKHSVVQNFSTINQNIQPNQVCVQDIYHEKCSGSKSPHTVAELPLLSRSHEQSSSGHSRSLSQSSSDTDEHLRKNGDVKLFGQILSHPSTFQKPIPTNQETGNKGATLPKSSSKSFNLKLSTDHGTDRMLVPLKIDASNYSNFDNFPMKSFGYWDGNRIQTGLPSLPDSAILLAKYPVAFGDHSASSSGDQQQLPSVIERNDRNLGRVSVFPTKDVSGNGGLSDYQACRSYSGAKVQPRSVDLKRHDLFSEMQKRNGFEVSSFQQQGRGGMVGMNVMGAGILVGGVCTGVSDPVAAIKMHYATTERYGGQAGSIREEESWKTDVGR